MGLDQPKKLEIFSNSLRDLTNKKKLEMFCNSLWDLTNKNKLEMFYNYLWDLTNKNFRNVVQLIIGLDPPQEGSKIYPLPLAYSILLRIIFLNFQLFSQTSNPSFDPLAQSSMRDV